MLTPEALKTRWKRLSLIVALSSTAVLSLALLITGHGPSLVLLWPCCFIPFWMALRIVGAIAWDTSFKPGTRLKVDATPRQVLCAELCCLAILVVFHVAVSWTSSTGAMGGAIFMAWLMYAAAALAAAVLVYLPALFVFKALLAR